MSSTQTYSRISETWKYAVVAGAASLPLTFLRFWLTGMEYFSVSMVFFGGILAGYLAEKKSLNSNSVGARAGMIGGVPSAI
ncbi:MAG: DUF5518 domain-containing protein [Halobacteria archaeon]|nr:DUF5518 domain-containing protein [Halobacteria archaeon]